MSEFMIKNGVLTRYAGKGGRVVIPDGVTAIAANAFRDNGRITEVVLPDSVQSIGYGAFEGCGMLASLRGAANVTEIGARALEHTLWIAAQSPFAILNSILVRYSGKGGAVTVPDGVTAIGNGAFYGCVLVTSVTLPDSVTRIGEKAFMSAAQLQSVQFGRGVTAIGNSAFYDCGALRSVVIPDAVETIDVGAFGLCRALQTVTFPDGLRVLNPSAFYKCENLRAVKLPDRVQSIGRNAFGGCRSLTDVSVGNGLTNVGAEAFAGTPWLAAQPPTVMLNTVLYSYRGQEERVAVPDGVTAVSPQAFWKRQTLREVTLPDSVTALGMAAFQDCEQLESVTLPSALTEIPRDAFRNCPSLRAVRFPDCLTKVEEGAFYGCQRLPSVTLPEGTVFLGGWAFQGCRSLTAVTLPDSLQVVNGSVFDDCEVLREIEASQAVWERVWTQMAPPMKVQWCLNRLDAGAPLQDREKRYVLRAFDELVATAIRRGQSDGLSAALALKAKVPLDSLDKWIADSDEVPLVRAVLLEYKARTYSAAAVEKFAAEALEKELGLRRRTAAEWKRLLRVSTAGGTAIITGIKTEDATVDIPAWIGRSRVTAIKNRAFLYCKTLEVMRLPDGVTAIGDYAFAGCKALVSLSVPDSVTAFGEYVFSGCRQLTVYGKAGSEAETYAKKHDIPFVAE